jgi:hypothetical protein
MEGGVAGFHLVVKSIVLYRIAGFYVFVFSLGWTAELFPFFYLLFDRLKITLHKISVSNISFTNWVVPGRQLFVF